MSAFALLFTSRSSRYPFTGLQIFATFRVQLYKPLDWYVILALTSRRRNSIRPVSCYAIFKGWLLLSQPPANKEFPHPFTLNHNFGTLSGGLGSSSRPWTLATVCLLKNYQHRSFIRFEESSPWPFYAYL